jgi:hypothetical protein
VLNGLGSTRVGGLAIHAYTHGGNGSAPIDPNLVFSDQKMGPPYQSINYHFRVYRNFMGAIPQAMRSHAVWITEANEFRELPGYNWDPHGNTSQWIQNAYSEINNWNAVSGNQKIRTVALFRWPDVWEGDRNYCVSCVGAAVEGFRQALDHDYRWGAAAANNANLNRSQSAVPGSISAGQAADVVIRVENTGGTTWTAGQAYRLGATSANQFSFEAFPCGGYSVSPTNARVFLCNDVAPGSSYDFRFRIRPAAGVTGLQALSLRMVRDGFEWFGNTETWSINVTGQPPGCAAAVPAERWKGEYFANMNLSGAPSMVRDDGAGFLEFDWQTGSPGISCGIGADNFSARWTRTVSLGGGTYRFTVTSDDGFRLYVDGQLVLDKWIVQAPTTYNVDVSLGAGNHSLRMDYFENGGLAVAKLSWRLVSAGVQTSKLGVHVVIGPRNGYGDFLRKIRDANKALAAVHCVDDFGAALEAKQYSARTVTVGRLRGAEDLIDLQKNPEANAEEFYAAVRDGWRANPSIDYWEAQNEVNSNYDWQKRFYLRLMDLAEADGFRLALFASSTGTPPRPQDDGGAAYQNIKDTCLRAKQGGHG